MASKISLDVTVLTTQIERRKIFYWLQKVSSLTAWHRIYAYYKAWAAATEKSVFEAEARGWSEKSALRQADLLMVMEGLAEFEKYAGRLAVDGNRKFRDISALSLHQARRSLVLQAQTVTRVDEGENGIDEDHTPFWQEYCEAMASLRYVWWECTRHIFTSNDFSAEFNYYTSQLEKELVLMPFPENLGAVPDPTEAVIVRANRSTPFAGIWEPVAAPKRTFWNNFSDSWKPHSPFEILGTMCYFEAHSRAPKIDWGNTDTTTESDMAWRLLWRDERYGDNTIPGAERAYRFMYPERSLAKRSKVGDGDVIWAESGAAAQADGRWVLEGHPKFGIMRRIGQRLPFSQGRPGRWILEDEGGLANISPSPDR